MRNLVHTRPHGFSLVELMVVVGIIGVIIAVGVPSVASAVERERLRSARATIPQQLELVLKEGRNRLLPVEFDVDADGIYYRFSPMAPFGFAFDSCGGSAGHTTACRLRQPTPCAILVAPDISDGCLPVRTTIATLLQEGDIDGAIQLWPAHKYGSAVTENMSDLLGLDFGPDAGLVQRIAHPLVRFDENFLEGGGFQEARFTVTPLGQVLGPLIGTARARTVRMTDAGGTSTTLQLLDSGLVRVLP